MRRASRFAVAAVCLAALFGLCVHYGGAYDENWPHPTGDQLRDDYDAYAGERVLLFGEVQSVDREAGTAVIRVTDSADELAVELEIDGVGEIADDVDSGGTVQIYGVLEADRTMTPDRTVVVNRDSSDHRYKLAASAAGGLFAVGYFLRHWRVNRHALAFEPRSDGPNDRNGSTTDDPSGASSDG